MAGAYSAPSFPVRTSTTITPPTLISKKPLLLSCSLITPRPRKFTKRKNYLRPKILKTLNKPYTNPQTEPIIPLQHTQKAPENQEVQLPEPDGVVDVTEGTFSKTPIQQLPSELETSENQETRLPEPAGVFNAGAGTFDKSSLLKYGLWVVGAFVFQTICAVWVLGLADYSGKNEVLELDLKGKSKYKMKMFVNGDGKQSAENGGILFVDEAEMEKKIEEIQHMAREAREKERLESKGTNFDEEDEDEIEDSDVKFGIKKEVDERLIKLRRGLEKVSSKQPTSSVTYTKVGVEKNDRNDGGNSGEKELSDALIFKRKHKFRDFASKPSNKPKGFMAPDHKSVGTNGEKNLKGKTEVLTNGNGEGRVGVSSDDEVNRLNLDSHRGAFTNFGESMDRRENIEEAESKTATNKTSGNNVRGKGGRSVKNVEGGKVDVKFVKKSLEKGGRKKRGVAVEESEPGIDISVNRNSGSSLFEAVDSKESSILETATIYNTGNTLVEVADSKESCSMKSTTTSDKHKNSNRNGISRREKVKDQKVVKPNGGTKSRNDTDFWWLSLPYVLAIRMWRGHEDEGPEGLFALKSGSQVNGGLSHTVAFEDRGDATNFCYLLQSFFEDLGDFSAEIVPLPVKELSEAIRLGIMKVIVVKKGKLKLYAGQPLAEAEMALRSLVEQE